MQNYKLFINGKWENAVSGETFDDFNPYTGELYATVAKAGIVDADRALAAAYTARKIWSASTPIERANVLFKAADILGERLMEIADILTKEGGGTFGKVMFEISQTIDLLKTAGGDCKNILGETYHTNPGKLSYSVLKPKGTIIAISPWNFPLVLSMYKIAYSIATGNTIIFKPASDTPVIGLKIGEIFEQAGLPAGVLNVLTGPGSVLGDVLIKDERSSFVTLTGETETGKHVGQVAAANLKGCTLELGGKNPLVVLKDSDINYAVNTAAFGTFMHQGEICMSVGRIIVEDPILEEFTQKLTKKAATIPFGNPAEKQTIVGPLINEKQVLKVDGLVKDAVLKGAKLLNGGAYKGRVYEPTVLGNVTKEMRIYHEETFGPVASIIGVRDEKEALEVANDTHYGLSAAVVTKDLQKALFFSEKLEAGMVHIGESSIDADPRCPFGGCKWSGRGREGGRYSLEELSEITWVTIEKNDNAYPF
jgi:aldehyde dehydrogenase (NAD+)